MWVKSTSQAFLSWTRREERKKQKTQEVITYQKLTVNNSYITTIPDQ